RHLRQVLELPHGLPADEADEPPGERRVVGMLRCAPARVQRIEGAEGRTRDLSPEGAFGAQPVVEPDGAVARVVALLSENAERAGAHERPARPDAALLGRLQQEGA